MANRKSTQFGTGRSRLTGSGVHSLIVAGVGNVGAGVDDLISKTLEANSLAENGQAIRLTAWGVTGANEDVKEVKLLFGGSAILATGAVAANAKNWSLHALIIRTAAGAQQYFAHGVFNDALIIPTFGTLTKDETTALIVKCTGESVTTDDIIQKGLLLEGLSI